MRSRDQSVRRGAQKRMRLGFGTAESLGYNVGGRAVRRAPVSLADAEAMIEEVRGLALLRGYRGLPRGDLGALARAICAVSDCARLANPRLREAEINPLIVKAEGVVAVDGRVVRAEKGE